MTTCCRGYSFLLETDHGLWQFAVRQTITKIVKFVLCDHVCVYSIGRQDLKDIEITFTKFKKAHDEDDKMSQC